MQAANYAPLYCSLYPHLAAIARRHGYAMAVHGSMARDFDLICIPWEDAVSAPETVVGEIQAAFACVPAEPVQREHGRMVYPLVFTEDCYLDLSFTPRTGPRVETI